MEAMALELEDIFSIKEPGTKIVPGYFDEPQSLCIVGSSAGTYDSIFKLISKGFKKADRLLLITPWESYAVFKTEKQVFLFRDALRSVNRVRRLDVNSGNYGLLRFMDVHECSSYITLGNEQCFRVRLNLKDAVDEIYKQI